MPPLDPLQMHLWSSLLDISERAGDWTLVGGQMVFLHALEHNRTPPRISRDIDVVVNVRVRPPALPQLLETLAELGFDSTGVISDDTAHRFSWGDVLVDVLAPDGVGRRVDLRTAGSAATVPISGGTYALDRTALVDIEVDERIGVVPRPELDGALIIKARAACADRKRGPERHLVDLAFLCSLVADPLALRELLTAKNRAHLTAVEPLLDDAHTAWQALGDRAADAKAAFDLIRRV